MMILTVAASLVVKNIDDLFNTIYKLYIDKHIAAEPSSSTFLTLLATSCMAIFFHGNIRVTVMSELTC